MSKNKYNKPPIQQPRKTGFSQIPFQNIVKEGITQIEINDTLQIINDGAQNDFPKYLSEIIDKSPTAAAAVKRLSQFITGSGLHEDIKDIVINTAGDTMEDLHNAVAMDYTYFDRFSIQLNPNRGGKVIESLHIPAEWVRYATNKDRYDPVYHYAKVNPYLNTSEEYWGSKQVKTLRLFENVKEISRESRESEDYQGHILFHNDTRPGARVYSRPLFFSAERTIVTDGRIWAFHDRNTANNFFLGFVMSILADPDAGYGEQNSEGTYYKTFREVFEGQMNDMFAGVEQAGTGMVFYKSNENDPDPSITPFPAGQSDEMFTRLLADTVNTIASTFGIPKVLLPQEISGKLGASNEIRNAILFVNETTETKRNTLEKAYKKILNAMGISYPDENLIIPIQDYTDLPDVIFNSLSQAQKDEYLERNFNILPSGENEAEMEEETEESRGIITELRNPNGRSNN